jgi:hypothetical protein
MTGCSASQCAAQLTEALPHLDGVVDALTAAELTSPEYMANPIRLAISQVRHVRRQCKNQAAILRAGDTA